MLQESPLTLKGGVTPRVQIYKSESHKLHQAFVPVHTNNKPETIIKGSPVCLTQQGNVTKFNSTNPYLGIAATDSINPAYGAQRNYPIEVTVMMEGFAVVNWIASEDLQAGYVSPVNYTDGDHTTKCEQAENATQFIALHPAEEGEIVQVLVK